MEIAPLLAMRGFPLSRSGGEMHWRIPGEESVSIRGNMWYSHYRGEGGDAISFVRHFFHAGSKELRRKILKEYGIPPGQQIVPGQERFPERQKPGMIQENV